MRKVTEQFRTNYDNIIWKPNLEKLFREMWNWCAETGLHKEKWSRWTRNSGDIKDTTSVYCFACVIGGGIFNNKGKKVCRCPIIWISEEYDKGKLCPCCHPNSPYDEWGNTVEMKGQEEEAKKWAKIIAELSWDESRCRK